MGEKYIFYFELDFSNYLAILVRKDWNPFVFLFVMLKFEILHFSYFHNREDSFCFDLAKLFGYLFFFSILRSFEVLD
jgi:hypothetical protein